MFYITNSKGYPQIERFYNTHYMHCASHPVNMHVTAWGTLRKAEWVLHDASIMWSSSDIASGYITTRTCNDRISPYLDIHRIIRILLRLTHQPKGDLIKGLWVYVNPGQHYNVGCSPTHSSPDWHFLHTWNSCNHPAISHISGRIHHTPIVTN